MTPTILRTECPHCAGHLEYDAADIDRFVDCPHCDVAFYLPAPLPPVLATPSPRQHQSYSRAKQIFAAASILGAFVIIMGVLIYLVPADNSPAPRAEDGSIAWILIFFGLYFFPTLIAAGRHHHNGLAIAVTNLLLGWTVLGWIIAFIWSLTAVRIPARAAIILFALLIGHHASGQANIGGFSAGTARNDPANWIRDYNRPDNFAHRYRIIAGPAGTIRYCDLSNAFTNQHASAWRFVRGEINQVHPHGLLLQTFNYNRDADRVYPGKSICLTNYPGHTDLSDGKTVKCFAIEIGTFQFRDYRGITRTVPLYDHGIPFDPSARAEALAKSNQLARAAATNSAAATNFIGALK